MSWGTSFKTEVFISRRSFNSIAELDAAIDEQRRIIEDCRTNLLMYAIATPKDIVEDNVNIPFETKQRVEDELLAYEEAFRTLTLLLLLKSDVGNNEEKLLSFRDDS